MVKNRLLVHLEQFMSFGLLWFCYWLMSIAFAASLPWSGCRSWKHRATNHLPMPGIIQNSPSAIVNWQL